MRDNNKKQRIYRTIMLIIVVATITFIVTSIINYQSSIGYLLSSKKEGNISQKVNLALSTITEIIREKYIGEINEDELVDGALKGLVASIGDVYTEYYTKEELDDFTASTLGNFVGIGVYMRADIEANTITVEDTIPGSPAEEAGLKNGDKILKIDGVEYKAEEISKVSEHVKGKEGTKVTLTIERDGKTIDLEIARKSVHINYVTGEMLENNIAYIYIETFDESCAEDFINQYNKLVSQGSKALIIDLRDNGGGVVDEATKIAEYICDKGDTLLITSDKNQKEEIKKSDNAPIIKVPIVVLTNKYTASASEILAGALKDNEKAELIGEKTYGKGVIQELVTLTNGGALKVTSAEYYTPNRKKINGVGIEPDKVIEDAEEQLNTAINELKEKIK